MHASATLCAALQRRPATCARSCTASRSTSLAITRRGHWRFSLGLLALGAATAATGWIALQESSAELWEEVHETFANLMLALVLLHIAAVIVSSRLHHENLVASMFSGVKHGQPEQAIRRGWCSIGLLVLLVVAVFWWLQWKMS